MTSALATAIAKSGILDNDSLKEFRRWGMPIDEMPIGPHPRSAQELVLAIEEALQSEGLIIEKITDLEVIQQFLATQIIGSLHVVVGTENADFPVAFGRTPLGEYILAWKGDTVVEEMTNGETYLQLPDGGEKIFFNSVREFYFGDQKAFMVCIGAPYVDRA